MRAPPLRASDRPPRISCLWRPSGNARVLSLEAFARYLSAPTPDASEARRALEEAEGVYHQLVEWDSPTTTFYRDSLQDSDAARAIRAASLRLKKEP